MPGALINNTLSSLHSGVTQQYQEGRFDSQVEVMENCIPSVTRGVMRRNPIQEVASLSGLPVDITDSFVYSYDRGTGTEQYIVVIPGDGYIHVFNANTGAALYKNSISDPYLVKGSGTVAKNTFKALTIGDHSFIVNTTIDTAFTSATSPTAGYADMAFHWVKKTVSVIKEQKQSGTDPVASGSLMIGYEYTLNGTTIEGEEDTRPGETAIERNTSTLIATAMVADSGNSLVTASLKSIAYNASFSGSD